MWILTAFPVIRKPMFNAEFLQWKHCGSFLMKHNSDEQVQLFDTYRHLFIRSHLAFGRHYRRRTPWPYAYSHRNQPQTLSTDSLAEALGRTHFSAGEKNVALSFALSSCFLLARSQALLWAHRCCRPVSSWDRSSNFGAQGLRWRGTTFVFPTEDPFFSRVLAWRVADVVNRTLWIAFKTFCRSPRNSFVPWEASASESCDTQPNCDTLFTPFFQPFVLLFIKFVMRKQTRVSALQPVFVWKNWHSGGCQCSQGVRVQVPFKKYLHGCRAMDPWLLLPRMLLFPDTHFYLVTGLARKVWRQCVLVFAHDLGLRGGNCNLIRCNSFSLLQIQFTHVWHQSFANEVSDLYSSSPWFSNFDGWDSISSDEYPGRTIPIRFWVDQTHVSLICTDFPRYHRMEFLSSITELRPITLSSRRVTEKKSA